ncbi:hypothetical protein [Piscinibacter gummiphilus]|uniref:Uncharacterized protein n=1 Tax=Piscinibacter gummiphilus TaxID=946333 RepID=A0A1W6L9U5_9BURK|nr:hypothetical protein [Piscinibacter gummiphilus]ARN21003.1 hypothetical protein A4W93_14480 [Piscinibacter gummiphilus]ATU65678.1 hypothetical protein CPZ87_14565 [Piscinibacter gummiphilus]GLS93537.1 hypothetical protein GCM10007918_08280 [Piscinibacter gummiphilus]
MKSSIGTTTPDTEADRDADGVPDQAERDFAEDGRPAASRPVPPPKHGEPANAPDDGGLESSRPQHGAVLPPAPN